MITVLPYIPTNLPRKVNYRKIRNTSRIHNRSGTPHFGFVSTLKEVCNGFANTPFIIPTKTSQALPWHLHVFRNIYDGHDGVWWP